MTGTPCRRVEPLLPLAAGGDLSPGSADAVLVEEHLRSCEDCRRAADAFAATVHTIRELPASSFSPEENAALRRGVWKRIAEIRAADRDRGAGSRGIAWKTAGWAAAGLVALLLLLPWRAARVGAPAARSAGSTTAAPRPVSPPSASAIAGASNPAASASAPRIAKRSAGRRFRPLPESSEPVRIELSTPNPNVRIVWLVGSAGEDLPPLNNDDLTTVPSPTTIKEDPQ